MIPALLRHLSVALICCCAGLAAGEAAAPPADELSPAAKRALAGAEDAIAKARAAYQAAAAKEQDKLVAALQKEQEAQTKAGKLEAALAVKALVEKVKSGEYAKELETRAADSDDLLGDKAAGPPSQLKAVVGTWHMAFNNGWRRLVRIEPDGRVNVLRSDNVAQGSTYTLRWDAKGKFLISGEGLGNMLEIYRLDGERMNCEHWCDASKYPESPCSLTAQVERHRGEPPPAGQVQPMPGQPGPAAPRREGR